MLQDGEAKSIAEAVASKHGAAKGDEGEGEGADDVGGELELASSALMDAMQSGDTRAFASAFKDMMGACRSKAERY